MAEKQIVDLLVERGREHMRRKLPEVTEEFACDKKYAERVGDLKNYPHAFVISCVVDRQIPAKRAWKIPYDLEKRIGSFEFEDLYRLKKEKLIDYFNKPTPLHRYCEEIAKCVYDAIQIIGNEYAGDASKMWSDKPSSAVVVHRFSQIRGVGPKIATMATNILARTFRIEFKDYHSIDISADIHITRVFYRLGLTKESASPKEIIHRAQTLHPEFPGLMDFPCWHIGRTWCKPSNPECGKCYMNRVCPTA